MDKQIQEAVTVINQGGIVVFPTDTAYGIGCRIDNEETIQRLFTLRKRPETQATPVLVANQEMAQKYLQPIPQDVQEKLIKPYWPGALTIILQCLPEKVPSLVRGGTDTLGVRMPNHETTLQLIREAGVPLLGPSANFHGDPTPYSLHEVSKKLLHKVDFVVKGECSVKQASTVINCTINPWQVLRQGSIKI